MLKDVAQDPLPLTAVTYCAAQKCLAFDLQYLFFAVSGWVVAQQICGCKSVAWTSYARSLLAGQDLDSELGQE